MNGKYGPLYDHIHRLDARGVREWHASFTEIERIIGDRLPPSARRYSPWWANDRTHNQAEAWMALSWKTHSVNLTDERVSFRQVG